MDGWTGEIEGSTRGPRGPKKTNCCCHLLNHKMLFLVLNLVFQNLCIAHGVYLATGSSNIENVGINVIVSQSVTLLLG